RGYGHGVPGSQWSELQSRRRFPGRPGSVYSGNSMLQIAGLLLAVMPLMAAELKVDHASLAGRDLHAMEQALAAAGIPYEYGGPHSNHATETALTSFPDGSYLDLIAIHPPPEPK